MKKQSLVITLILLLAFSSLLAACGNNSNSIKIGWFGPLTGETATDGIHSRDAAQLAIDEVNKQGGINGKKVELVAVDDQGKPEEALKAVQKLINNDHVSAIIDGAYSGPSKTVAPKVQKAKIPMIAAYALHPDITKGGKYVNRVIYTGVVQGKAMADFAVNDLKKKNFAVLYVDLDYGKTIFGAFEQKAKELGANIAYSKTFEMGDKDFSSILTTVKASNPDALYVVGYYNEASAIVKQAKEVGLNTQLLGVDGFDSPKYLELGEKNTEGSIFSTSFYATDSRDVVKNFVKAWEAKYKSEPDMLSSQSYDSAMVILNAMKQAGTDTEKLADAINATKDFEGTSGKITFGADHEAIKPVIFMEVKDGKFQFVKAKIYN